MELFIWNDFTWRVIKETDDYNKDLFFIVRTLFVQWPKQDGAEQCNDEIRKYFDVYGNIESVETVNGKASNMSTDAKTADAANSSNIHEAYVTFAQSKDAFDAFSANRRDTKAIKVLPADTWHQPGVELNPHDDADVIMDIEHRCGEPHRAKHEFISTSMAELTLNDQNLACKNAKYSDDLNLDKWSLKLIREVYHQLKSGFGKVNIKCHYLMSNNISVNCLSCGEYLKRVAQVLSASIGDDFDELDISFPEMKLTTETLDGLAPLLRRLKRFAVSVDSLVLYQLREYCPNVQNLRAIAQSLNDDTPDAALQRWPTLVYLSVTGNMKLEGDTPNSLQFRRFVEMNPQLEVLQLDSPTDADLLKIIAANLPNLKSLHFIQGSYDNIDSVLNALADLKCLETLGMSTLMTKKTNLNGMFKCAGQFRQMKQLKMATLFQNFEPDTAKSEQYERFLTSGVSYHNDCKCHGSKRVVEFEKGIPGVTLPPDVPVLVVVVNSKNPKDTADQTLKDTILCAFNAMTAFYPTKIRKFTVNNNGEFKFYLICHA